MPGPNNIRQSSNKSSITIPYERTFRPIGADYQPTDAERLAEFRFCGCGWPEHMLLPRGKPEGMSFELFAMISDYDGDAVQQMNNRYVLIQNIKIFTTFIFLQFIVRTYAEIHRHSVV